MTTLTEGKYNQKGEKVCKDFRKLRKSKENLHNVIQKLMNYESVRTLCDKLVSGPETDQIVIKIPVFKFTDFLQIR